MNFIGTIRSSFVARTRHAVFQGYVAADATGKIVRNAVIFGHFPIPAKNSNATIISPELNFSDTSLFGQAVSPVAGLLSATRRLQD